MWAWIWSVAIGALLPPGWAYVLNRWIMRQRVPSAPFFVGWFCGCGGLLLANSITWDWRIAVCAGASLAAGIAAWLYWRHRGRKDRTASLASAKGRAIIAALVRRAREAAQPRPVLRPVPGGAR